MPKVDLTLVPTKRLKAEIARREAEISKAAPAAPKKQWVCACGNTADHTHDLSRTFIEFDNVWCRLCYPDMKLTLHSGGASRLSIPMRPHAN